MSRAPDGVRVDGVLPYLQRMDASTAEHLLATRTMAAPIWHRWLGDILANHGRWVTRQPVSAWPEGHDPWPAYGEAKELAQQIEDAAAVRGDSADVVDTWTRRLWQAGSQCGLWTEAERWMQEVLAELTSPSEALGQRPVFARLWPVYDPKTHGVTIKVTADTVFDEARLEGLVALSPDGTGLLVCDQCGRLFVRVAAGRPTKRCPGFDCSAQAERKYQASPERRQYRALLSRRKRALDRGDHEAVALVDAEISQWRTTNVQREQS